jgi:hypothetical protein
MQTFFRTLPTLTIEEFRKSFQAVNMKLDMLRDRIHIIIDGRRKRQLSDWWLTYIETEVDRFLTDHGLQKNCLPHDYMNKKPESTDAVKETLNLLTDLMKVGKDETKLDRFIFRVVNEVYSVLDEFIEDMHYVSTNVDGVHQENLKKDVDYLLQMKSMDEDIKRQRQCGEVEASGKFEMSNVVPICGLLMARLHMFKCELETALELWDKDSKFTKTRNQNIYDTIGRSDAPQNLAASALFPIQNSPIEVSSGSVTNRPSRKGSYWQTPVINRKANLDEERNNFNFIREMKDNHLTDDHLNNLNSPQKENFVDGKRKPFFSSYPTTLGTPNEDTSGNGNDNGNTHNLITKKPSLNLTPELNLEEDRQFFIGTRFV